MSTLWEKDTPKSEWNKLKKLSPKEIAWYLWEYYKWPILAIAALTFLIISWAISYRESRKDIVIYGALINESQLSLSENSYFSDTYAAFRNVDLSRQRVELRTNLHLDASDEILSEASISAYQILMAEITSRKLDFIASDRETMAYYSKSSNSLMDLRDCLPESMYEQLEAEGRLVWLYHYDFDPAQNDYIQSEETYPTLIDFSDSHFVEGMKLLHPQLFVGFVSNTTRMDEIPYFVEYMDQKQ